MTVQPERLSMEPWIKDSIHYYSHQIEGIRKMAVMRNVLLADDMGLGKSLQAITVFAIDVQRGVGRNCLIVAPASLKSNWKNEIEQFTGGFQVEVIQNTGANIGIRQKQIDNFARVDKPKFLIVNYEQVKSLFQELNSIPWDMVIFDEAHMIKNPTAKRTKACHKLISSRFLLLTGSPLLNHVNDLWSLLHIISPGELGSYHHFCTRYVKYGGFQGRQIVGVKNENELYSALHRVMIRRLKEDVLDLPPVQYVTRFVELSAKQRKLYDQVVKDMQLTFIDESGHEEIADVDNPLAKYLRLKQICGTTATVGQDDDSTKLDAAVWDADNILNEYGEKIVAFTQFRPVLHSYVERLTAKSKFPNGKEKYKVFYLHGDVPTAERQEIIDQWSRSTIPAIVICMYQVAGVGFNMTAGRYGQRLDKLYTPSLNQQAVDRMHRIGADKNKPILMLDYRAKDTAEDRVEKILEQKKTVSKNIVEENANIQAIIKSVIQDEARR